MKFDLDIQGRGFYLIAAVSARGRRFMRQVQGTEYAVVDCEGTQGDYFDFEQVSRGDDE